MCGFQAGLCRAAAPTPHEDPEVFEYLDVAACRCLDVPGCASRNCILVYTARVELCCDRISEMQDGIQARTWIKVLPITVSEWFDRVRIESPRGLPW